MSFGDEASRLIEHRRLAQQLERQGLSDEVIAQVMGISLAAVRALLERRGP